MWLSEVRWWLGEGHELVAKALHGRGIPGSERKGRREMVRWQMDNGPNISPHPEEAKDKWTDLFRCTRV